MCCALAVERLAYLLGRPTRECIHPQILSPKTTRAGQGDRANRFTTIKYNPTLVPTALEGKNHLMVEGDFWVLFAMLVYFIVVLTIGFVYAKRSNSSTSEYFIGGRKVGPWLTALSAEASDMSGYLLMGLPGLAYFTGASDAGWTAVGLAIGTYLNWRFVAKRLRMYSVKAGNAITLPGFYSKRFNDERNIVSTIAALIILVFFCVYVGSCFVTCGKLFNTLFGLDYLTMMCLGAIIVFLYTLVGGYLSVVATDFVQGCLMFFALIVVLIGSITMAGGVDNVVTFLNGIPGFLSGVQIAVPVVGEDGFQIMNDNAPLFDVPAEYGVLSIVSMLAWGLGYFGMPQVLVRFLGIRSAPRSCCPPSCAASWCRASWRHPCPPRPPICSSRAPALPRTSSAASSRRMRRMRRS